LGCVAKRTELVKVGEKSKREPMVREPLPFKWRHVQAAFLQHNPIYLEMSFQWTDELRHIEEDFSEAMHPTYIHGEKNIAD
jgi:hypothetical protein